MTEIACWCGAARAALHGAPLSQFYCHCDDCQGVHGAAYVSVALYPADSVRIIRGEVVTSIYRTMPRERCAECATQLFGRVPGQPVIGVKANLLPAELFTPAFHIRCRYALLPVVDTLPHYKDLPSEFGGTNESMVW